MKTQPITNTPDQAASERDKVVCDFEYTVKWAMLNDFDVTFRRDSKLRVMTATFQYFHEGRVKSVQIAGWGYEDFFRKIEHQFPRLVMDLKHITLEDAGVKP